MNLSGSYPSPPNVLYIPYPVVLATRIIGSCTFYDLTFYFDVYDFPVGAPIKIQYRSYKTLPAHWDYAELNVGTNEDFAAAVAVGNLSGSYTGTFGETWFIEHRQDDIDIDLPSGEGGETGTVFSNEPPIYEPPARATNPTPIDDAENVSVNTMRLEWD